ncbi:MAG: [FeFe] hydrogenase H-cluster maturation GTPase HydF [Bacteroidales bacterium]|jgi:[FeFe] hydrogenase H-cluster maturation GTPase HydF|nr:[FeFe] hydrogenase H-cluster maturation GTPase HydF [Bacteroidales bacterium]
MSKGRDQKPHIGIFGKRNTGKSSFINTIINQDVAIVSSKSGTTTDPVKKSIEIFGVGPAIIIDTAGIDDKGELGLKRIAKTKKIVKIIDLAILLIAQNSINEYEINLIKEFDEYSVPYFIIHNKSDLEKINKETRKEILKIAQTDIVDFSTIIPTNLNKIINLIKKNNPPNIYKKTSLLNNLVSKGDIIMLVMPIDKETPEGRLILPEVMAIRDVLDNDCSAIVLKDNEIESFLNKTHIKLDLVITDSQVFESVNKLIPLDIPLTSFSILLAYYKGDFQNFLRGTPKLSDLKENDKILILESCAHQIECGDIGREKLPYWLSKFTDKKLYFDIVSGLNDLPRNIHDYAIVIQCGGCVLTNKQIINRLKPAIEAGIPVSNYGMTISYIHGLYQRAITPFIFKK